MNIVNNGMFRENFDANQKKLTFVKDFKKDYEYEKECFNDSNGSLNVGYEIGGEFYTKAQVGFRFSNDDLSTGIYGQIRTTGEGGSTANVISDKHGGYLELTSGLGVSSEVNVVGEQKVGDFSMGGKLGVNTEGLSEYSLKIGASTFRKNDEIVSEGGIYGALRAQMNVGVHTEISTTSQDGYIRGLFNVQTGIGIGGAAGWFSQAIVDTKNWNVKFSTITELDIGTVFDFGFVADFEGEVNINNEVNLIREDLRNYIKKEEENLKISKKTDIKVDRLKEQIINILPIWNQKIAFIKQSVRDKIENISVGFFKHLSSRLKDIIKMSINNNRKNVKIFGNILSRGKEFTLKTAAELLDIVGKGIDFSGKIISKGLYHLLFPKIDSAINEIKPTDIIRDL